MAAGAKKYYIVCHQASGRPKGARFCALALKDSEVQDEKAKAKCRETMNKY